MYSNKENINLLTSLLVAKGITDAVVCPGSRNAPIVHNLNEAEQITCHPVTDERSAGFYAVGLAQATGRPVVVCVTSGSALLNVAPAVAEAFYQHVPLIVVSADRPQQWIGQLDGQTLPQQGAFGPMVRRSVQLPEPHDEEERWLCGRLINETLHLATCKGCAPVHINVPVTEPLFLFDEEKLPETTPFKAHTLPTTFNVDTFKAFAQAKRPMVVLGQLPDGAVATDTLCSLSQRCVVLAEPLSSPSYNITHGDEAVRVLTSADGDKVVAPDSTDRFAPNAIVYIGGTVVSKTVRRFLRQAKAPTWVVTPNVLEVSDPLMTLTDIVECPLEETNALLLTLVAAIANYETLAAEEKASCATNLSAEHEAFRSRWQRLLDRCGAHAESYEPPFSQMATVRYFESQLEDLYEDLHVHYANSSAVRLANIYAAHRVWCNRGVNGIEGSLSTAAGFSLGTTDKVVCVIGDLSFFYDQNALWNGRLRGNLRIILLNNHEGGIFSTLPGLDGSPAAHDMVAAAHNTEARGICTQNDIGYLKATNMDEMQVGVVTLLTQQADRPMVLEVFTDAAEDAKAMREYFESLK